MKEAAEIRRIVDAEVARREPFDNWHGITIDNLETFLVTPFEIPIDPDDLETAVRSMWVVLQEVEDATQGYVVVYDPSEQRWGLATHAREGEYVLISSADSFAEAVSSM